MPTTCKLKADTGKLGHHPDLQEDRELADVVRPVPLSAYTFAPRARMQAPRTPVLVR